jgi:hypothetical protein
MATSIDGSAHTAGACGLAITNAAAAPCYGNAPLLKRIVKAQRECAGKTRDRWLRMASRVDAAVGMFTACNRDMVPELPERMPGTSMAEVII